MALTVNGEGITVVEFDSEVARYIAAQAALGVDVDSTAAASVVIDEFVAQLLLAQAARGDGFSLDEVALQARIDSLAAEIGGAAAHQPEVEARPEPEQLPQVDEGVERGVEAEERLAGHRTEQGVLWGIGIAHRALIVSHQPPANNVLLMLPVE